MFFLANSFGTVYSRFLSHFTMSTSTYRIYFVHVEAKAAECIYSLPLPLDAASILSQLMHLNFVNLYSKSHYNTFTVKFYLNEIQYAK